MWIGLTSEERLKVNSLTDMKKRIFLNDVYESQVGQGERRLARELVAGMKERNDRAKFGMTSAIELLAVIGILLCEKGEGNDEGK